MDIISKDELKKYIKVALGAPIIKVELDDVHLDQQIDRAIQKFHRYNAGEGSIYDYAVFETEAGKSEYNLRSIEGEVAAVLGTSGKPPTGDELTQLRTALDTKGWEACSINIESIKDITAPSSNMNAGGINDLFSPSHGWFYSGGGGESLGVRPGTSGPTIPDGATHGGYNSGVQTQSGMNGLITNGSPMTPALPLSNFVQFKQQMKLIDRIFGKKIMHIWRADAGIVKIFPTPITNEVVSMRYWRREDAVYLYNNTLFKDLAIAYCGVMWGSILGKYSTTMAGGGTINADAIKSEYSEKLVAAKEAIKKETWAPMLRRG